MQTYCFGPRFDVVRSAIHGFMGDHYELPSNVEDLEKVLLGIKAEIEHDVQPLTERQREHLQNVRDARSAIAEQLDAVREEKALKQLVGV